MSDRNKNSRANAETTAAAGLYFGGPSPAILAMVSGQIGQSILTGSCHCHCTTECHCSCPTPTWCISSCYCTTCPTCAGYSVPAYEKNGQRFVVKELPFGDAQQILQSLNVA